MTDTRSTASTCPYCGVGCGVIISSEGAQITGVRGDPQHPANFGRLCTKGATLHLTAAAPVTLQTRLLHPMRRTQRGQPAERIGWDAALDLAADAFARTITAHGPDAVGFYASGQLLTEDYYLFNKLAKGLIGTNNLDTNSRLCMSSAVAGYKHTLGADAPPACYEDIDHAGCLFIAGSNTAFAHPILFRRIEVAKAARPGMKIVVCDPRRTDTAAFADLHLPLLPGTDVMLYHGMLHLMLWEGRTDAAYIAAHTSGFDALKALVRDCSPDTVARVCGIDRNDLLTAARWFAGVPETSGAAAAAAPRQPTLSLYCQGLNQSTSGTAKNAVLINLHLATGQIGRPGAGPLSLTGQPNAMGGREVGGMANLLSGHRDLANPAHRAEVAALWGVPSVPAAPGKTAVELFQAAADGEIKALWIACTNPAQSMPDQATVRRALERCEFVVVQEAFAATATCAFADLLLPATTWGEKDGTVTNSERRISRVRAAVPAPGSTRHDWAIAQDFAQRLQARLPADAARPAPWLAYPDAESIWNEHRATTRGRDLDITGLSYALLDQHGPQQWPCSAADGAVAMQQPAPVAAVASEAATAPPAPPARALGRARLYQDGRFATADGRARFVATPYQPVAEPRDARYPFALTTGRLRDQWHGMSRTGTLGRSFGHAGEPCVELHPHDLQRRNLAPGDLVQVTSRRGSIVLPVQASDSVQPTQAFIAMHWGEEFLSGRASTGGRLAGINALTTSAFCPDSKQPELKHTAVKVLKAELPWTLVAMAWLPDDRVLAARDGLRVLLAEFAFASCVPFSNNTPLTEPQAERSGVLFRAADHQAPPAALLSQIEALLALDSADTARYADRRRGLQRAIRLRRGAVAHAHGPHPSAAADTTLDAFLLAGDTRAEPWLRTLLQHAQPVQSYGRLLLVPGAAPPVPLAPRGQTVCSCLGVTDRAIRAALPTCVGTADERFAALQDRLHCGTQCGSCIPELKRLVSAVAVDDTAAAAAGA